MTAPRPKGYWKDFSNLESELEPIIEELGHFPTQSELQELGKSSIINGIQVYYSGMNAVREKMGYGSLKKPNGYWKEFSNLESELDPIIEELGHFPTQKELS
ncbi:hypothetical protein HN799_02140, partial [Candidatus Woesearchaeota archaeon]|nr:hypothetical protein [Candidatus Woesearchaeota archaeon]